MGSVKGFKGKATSWYTGDMWHVCLEGLKDVGSLCYGWRAEADVAWEGRSRFHPGTVLPIRYATQNSLL